MEPQMLQLLAPGITMSGNPQNTRPFDSTAATISVSGGQTYSTSFQLDGIPDNVQSSAMAPSARP